MRNQKKNLLPALTMVGRNREGFQEVVTFELSLENFRIRKFRDEDSNKDSPGKEDNAGKGTEVRDCLMHVGKTEGSILAEENGLQERYVAR